MQATSRYVIFVGGTGSRMATALICAAAAGVYPDETLNVLLADTAHQGLRSAEMVTAQAADYERIRSLLPQEREVFRTELRFASWPRQMPAGAATLQQWTQDSPTDQLLCQALFDQEAAQLNLLEGFHGRRMLGQVAFAGLLHEAQQHEDDPLESLADSMVQQIDEGIEVRVTVAGSLCGGAGAAGIPALLRYIHDRTGGKAQLAAVVTTATSDEEDASSAREALDALAREECCGTVCVLGLPRASRVSAPGDYARLTDWLAVYCMDVLLHRPTWLRGVFTVQAEQGALSWSIFGRAEERYRRAWGRLVKAAAAWTGVIGPVVEKRLERPNFLRDSLFGWYARYFRRARGSHQLLLEDARSVSRLMRVVLLWLGGVCRTLPEDMKSARALGEAWAEGSDAYDQLTALVSHLGVLDDDAQRNDLYEDTLVHRRRDDGETESEQAMRRIDAVKMEIARRSAEQERLNRRMGGPAVMRMLQDALERAEADCREQREKYAEANRRIDHAESIAAPEDMYRITDARTRLQRMERHQVQLDARAERIREDLAAAEAAQVRFDKPALKPGPAENGMFLPNFASTLLKKDALSARDVERLWGSMVLPAEEKTFRETMKAVCRAPVDEDSPVTSLLEALMLCAMEV